MAAPLIPLSQQIPTGNSLYESYYKQVDPAYTGRVGASEAALFLKKSGLSDIILGKKRPNLMGFLKASCPSMVCSLETKSSQSS
ncbi:epidermal growth factor receptor pathway substrate 15 like 1 [Homo sapiens]|uniref:Epidermal growth factor receptor pathway substrate 15 like 1 n=2 Tax=Hominidae TaxID=9604 RepID=M0R330_HUMAN|nr:epidermal growth factor receptor pathway substrate 15 like 1 [Homo sapiens]KAI4041128.1 epidermal growth factor receptor pathway substrate 15 like 1 [Homo sapiens]PNJ28706.1 EPS15L1 isoform 9 [Pongo abelii]